MLTETLARFAHGQRRIPEPILHEARRSVLNGLAAALGAVDEEPIPLLARWARSTAASGPARVWGYRDAFVPAAAAVVNGSMVQVLEFDDTHPGTIIHPTAVVFPAALHPAEERELDGAAAMSAFVIGAEVALRLGAAVFPEHYDRGFQITSTAGAVGAAAAAARVLGLDALRMQHALGVAASLGSGLRETFGTPCKPFQVGHAARNGIVAAELAALGLATASEPLAGRMGWANATAGGYRLDKLDGLGETWLCAENTYKAFACGVVTHPSVDGVIRLREEHALQPEQVEAIRLQVSPRTLDLCGNPAPTTGLEGKFSVFHAAAAALVDGKGSVAQFTTERVNDATVCAVRGSVAAVASPALADDQARVEVELTDGRRLKTFVEHCVGSLQQPMSDGQLETKFRSLADGHLSVAAQAAIIDLVWNLDRLADVRELGHRLQPERE